MTNLLPWLLAHVWLFVIVLAFVVFLTAGLIFLIGWYAPRWLRHVFDTPPPLLDSAYGDVPHITDAAKRLHPTKGYGWASRHGKRANG